MNQIEKRHQRGAMVKLGGAAMLTFALTTGLAMANGLGENRSWQFDTTADKVNKTIVLDMIEKKRGGYYDGFDTITTIYNETNIGSQVNCNNIADAAGNIADNAQVGSSSANSPSTGLTADATGNDNISDAGSEGSSASDGSSGSIDSDQDNVGPVTADIDGSSSNANVSGVSVGNTGQDMLNDQDNSGDQYAGVDSSTACQLEGSTITGVVDLDGTGILN